MFFPRIGDRKLDTILSLMDVTKDFQIRNGIFRKPRINRALDNINISIERGEILGIVGESGSGKTTLGLLMLGLLKKDSGKIIFEGEDLDKISSHHVSKLREKSQMIFQDPFESLNPMLTVEQAVATPLLSLERRMGREDRLMMIINALNNAGMQPGENFLNKLPTELSGGQRQRVGIARALVNNPTFIVADEPVSMLDVSIRADILNLLKEQALKNKVSMAFISHDIVITKYIADRLLVMHLGQVVEIGPADEVVNHPKHPYTKLLISSIPDSKKNIPVDREIASIEYSMDVVNSGKNECSFVSKCPFAMEKCKTSKPEMKDVSQDHTVACYLI